MSHIHILSDQLINQIAAGEVVERPASVVKELVENCIDAGATLISVEIEQGGTSLIRVRDNGFGMDRSDAELAFQRHATSKIATSEDLFAIRTMGFRGEALASIASVAHVTLDTKQRESGQPGTHVQVEDSVILEVRDAGVPEGTTITVKNLFYNTPARKKFLKSDATEYGHILGHLTATGMMFPNIHFIFQQNGKVVFDVPRVERPLDRIGALLGNDIADAMIPVFYGGADVTIEGFIGKPEVSRGSRSHQYFFVNGREVNLPSLGFAVKDAFGNLLMDRKFPVFVIRINVPPHLVDVNVHPRKMEVKFVHPNEVFVHLRRAVEASLESHVLAPKVELLREEAATAGQVFGGYVMRERAATYEPRLSPEEQEPTNIFETPTSSMGLRALCQMKNSYIVADREDGMVLIDQHAAHERVMYERLIAEVDRKEALSQPLLMPQNLELSLQEVSRFEKYRDVLLDIGFDMESFGGNTVIVRAVPTGLEKEDPGVVVSGLLDDLERAKGASTLQGRREAALEYVACRSAVKFGQVLSVVEMQALLDQLEQTPRKFTCPHGRPTMIVMTFEELLRRFGRK